MVKDESVATIFNQFKVEMKSVGRKVSFPKDTAPEKTYLYRYLKRFANQVEEWEMDVDMSHMMISLVVRYAKDHGMLDRGAALLTMGSILEVCHQQLSDQVDRREDQYVNIKQCKEFLEGKDLLERKRPGGYCNLTIWYQTGLLSLAFLSVSKRCLSALAKLPKIERSEFPSKFDLMKSRIALLCTAESRKAVRKIMGADLQPIDA